MQCKNCGIDLVGEHQKIFCSRRCSATFHNASRKTFKLCAACGKKHKNKLYCSYKCSANAPRTHPKYRWVHLSPEERKEKDRIDNLVAVRRYQAKKRAQLPPDADLVAIKLFYANCPEGHEVDHIIPISKGGLHHQDNLQYLPILENRRKSNKLNYTPLAERLGT